MFWQTCIAHVHPELLGPLPLRVEAMLLSIIVPATMWVGCAVLIVRPHPLGEPNSVLETSQNLRW
jgi:hypothetical protein